MARSSLSTRGTLLSGEIVKEGTHADVRARAPALSVSFAITAPPATVLFAIFSVFQNIVHGMDPSLASSTKRQISIIFASVLFGCGPGKVTFRMPTVAIRKCLTAYDTSVVLESVVSLPHGQDVP